MQISNGLVFALRLGNFVLISALLNPHSMLQITSIEMLVFLIFANIIGY
jgi:hypothetical protein